MSRGLKFILLLLVVAGIGLVSLPWWLGVALRPVLKARGATFAHYERAGYAHFRLQDVRYTHASVLITAREVQTLTPLVWLGQRLRGREPTLMVTGWELQRVAAPTAQSAAPAQKNGLLVLQATLRRIAPRLGYWLPRAKLRKGAIHGFGPDISIAEADWRAPELSVTGMKVADHELAFTLAAKPDGSLTLVAHSADNLARLQLVWADAEITGGAVLWEQPLQLSARFAEHGWLPAEATAVAENWQLPASRVQLGAPYAEVRGGARLHWQDGALDLALDAHAEPAADTKTKAPPFEAHAAAHGNLRELTLTALAVEAPFASAQLSAPVVFSLDQPRAAAPAQLKVQVDLAKLPWIDARGHAEGTVAVTGHDAAAQQDFALEFTDVVLPGLGLQKARARGRLEWPRLTLNELEVQLDETSSVTAHGGVNCQTRELTDVTVQAKLTPAWFAHWLPADVGWTLVELTATAEGPLAAPRHQGSVKFTAAHWPRLQPADLDASWQGTGTTVEIAAGAKAGAAALELAGTLDPSGLQLRQLQLAPADQPGWQLAAPTRLSWKPVWRVDPLQLTGPASRLNLEGHGGPDGFITLTATGVPSTWLQDWLPLSGPAWEVHTLQTTGRFEDNVLVFDSALTAQIEMSPRPAEVKLVAHGDAQGVQLKEFTVIESGRVLTQAAGRLPLTWTQTTAPHVRLDEAAPLELTASTEPDSPLWAALAAFTGVELVKPRATIGLKGTVRAPAGELQFQAATVQAVPGRVKFALPELADVNLSVEFDRAAVTLKNFSGRLDGQAVQASGRMPMEDGDWRQAWRDPRGFDWSKAAARVEIPAADLAPLARRFPKFIAAQGRLHAFVELKPGGKFSGELHLADAASRPLSPFGPLHEIQADLTLDDRTITVQRLTANLGGEPVTMAGTVMLKPGAPPRLALELKGKNLPLVRNTGLLLRADFDLSARTDDAGVTRLGGAVEIRQCLLLASLNLQTLLPTGVRGVTRRPPYFSVAAPPFADWLLGVEVRALRTVRLRTTVFNGTASAHFRLGGTLGEPRAIGELTVDEGRVLFPFASFQVQNGSVRLREADPFHAVLNLSATSQRQDYQLQLEATGTLPKPNIVLSSTPALEAGEVLLLVMTGQPPADGLPNSSSTQRLAILGAYLSRGLFQDLGVGGGEDRLEISAGAQVSEQGKDTFEFEYKLGDRTSLVGEYDRFDSYNAGLKFRVFTQESTPLEKK